MAQISMDLVWEISQAMFVSNTAIELLTGSNASGVMHSITQQLGLGLILSTLLIVVPPMAGMWFNGLMGQFNAYSPLSDRWNANAPVPHHVDGGKSHQQTMMEDKIHHQYKQMGQNQNINVPTSENYHSKPFLGYGSSANTTSQPEAIKQHSQLGNAVSSSANTAAQIAQQNFGSAKSKVQKGEES